MWIEENEYREIVKKIPIACVDLIVRNINGEVLLLRRNDEPARDEWWFPGGRVYHGESRYDAAHRKLLEECGLQADKMTEWKTLDVLLYSAKENRKIHSISTFYLVIVSNQELSLDSHTSKAMWKKPMDWQMSGTSEFVKDIFKTII